MSTHDKFIMIFALPKHSHGIIILSVKWRESPESFFVRLILV